MPVAPLRSSALRWPVTVSLLCVFGAPADPPSAAACTPDFAEADNVIQTMVSAVPLPGAGLWIFDAAGTTIHQRLFGSYNANTVIPVASSSKWLSAAVIMALVDDGTLRLDDTIGAFLPYFTGARAGMTLRQLFSQTSGLDNQNDAPCLADADTTLDQCARQIASTVAMLGAPGSVFCYGGNSMQAAGRMAEVASGRSWSQLFTEKIRLPLGLFSTGYAGGQNPLVGGGLVTTMNEYGRFLRMILNDGVHGTARVLSSAAVAEMQQDQSGLAAFLCSPAPPYVHYGIGEWRDVADGVPAGSQISSPGKFGFYPWIDKVRGIAGIFQVNDAAGSAAHNLRLVAHQVQRIVRDRLDAAASGLDGDADGAPDCRDNCPAAANATQADGDGDGAGDACDCAPANRRVWAVPDGPDLLIFYPGGQVAGWQASSHPGGYVLNDRHDLVRSTSPSNFTTGGFCAGSDVAPQNDLIFRVDLSVPGAGQCLFYLARAENGCGAGPAGYGSGGEVIEARACP